MSIENIYNKYVVQKRNKKQLQGILKLKWEEDEDQFWNGINFRRKIIIIVNRKRAINLYLNEHVHLARDLGKFKT